MNLTEEIRFEAVEGIAMVTIDRPQARNAINTGVLEGLRLAWQKLESDDSLRVGILIGSGDKAFCAGMDLKQAAATQLPCRRATCSRSWATG
jgi:enoyl-CoA hydratase/carnithine racemase